MAKTAKSAAAAKKGARVEKSGIFGWHGSGEGLEAELHFNLPLNIASGGCWGLTCAYNNDRGALVFVRTLGDRDTPKFICVDKGRRIKGLLLKIKKSCDRSPLMRELIWYAFTHGVQSPAGASLVNEIDVQLDAHEMQCSSEKLLNDLLAKVVANLKMGEKLTVAQILGDLLRDEDE